MHSVILRRVGFVLASCTLLAVAAWLLARAGGSAWGRGPHEWGNAALVFFLGGTLLRGSLRGAIVVRWLALMGLALTPFIVLLTLLVVPPGLLLARLRFEAPAALGGFAVFVAVNAIAAWTAHALDREPVRHALAAASMRHPRALLPVAIGAAIGVFACGVLPGLVRGDTARHALELAQRELGPGYRVSLEHMNVTGSLEGDHVQAVVVAWNERGIRRVPVQWRKGVPLPAR